MDRRCVEAGHPVGQHDIVRLALFRSFGEPNDIGQHRPVAGRGDLDLDGPGEIDGAGMDRITGLNGKSCRFAGHQAGVDLRPAAADDAVGGQPLARRHRHAHARRKFGRGNPARVPPVIADHRYAAILQRDQPGRGGLRLTPGAPVEKAPDQQEEQQGDRRIEIGMRPAADRFPQADSGRQRHRERNRHVHVGPAGAQGLQRRAEEGPPGPSQCRQGDQRREPVEQTAGLGRHAFGVARPDRQRQQHDIGRGETGDCHAADHLPFFRGGPDRQAFWHEDRGVIAGSAQRGDEAFAGTLAFGRVRSQCADLRVAPADAHPPLGQVRTGPIDSGQRREGPFDLRDAGAAMHAVHMQADLADRR